MTERLRQACILVGGKGTRLGEVTRSIPKPLLDIGDGLTFLDFLIEQVTRQGFDDVILLAGYLGDQVKTRYSHAKFGAAQLRVLVEPEALGTAGALAFARRIIAPKVLLMNGDSFFDINLRALVKDASATNSEAVLALRRVSDASRYGVVELDGNRVTQFREKNRQLSGPVLVNAGIYVLTATIIDRIRSLPSSIETQIFPALATENKLSGVIRNGYFLDIGLPETLEQGRRELLALRRRPAVFLDRDVVVEVGHGYGHLPEPVIWVSGAKEGIRRLNDLGYCVVIVTNQVGIDQGCDGENTAHALHAWMQDQLAACGAFADAFCCRSYYSDMRNKKSRSDHLEHKPAPCLPAMIGLDIDKVHSFLISGKSSDLEVARNAAIQSFRFTSGNLASFIERCL